MMTSWTSSADTFDRFRASRIATAPSSGALSGESAPRNLPIGVRAAPTMTGVRDLSAIARIVGRFLWRYLNLTPRIWLLKRLRLQCDHEQPTEEGDAFTVFRSFDGHRRHPVGVRRYDHHHRLFRASQHQHPRGVS